jgi:hypothetical protein
MLIVLVFCVLAMCVLAMSAGILAGGRPLRKRCAERPDQECVCGQEQCAQVRQRSGQDVDEKETR